MGSPSEVNPPGYNIQQHTDSVKDVSKEETAEVCQDRAESRWEPGFFRRFPYLGFAALLLCIGCTGVAIGIIRLSHHGDIEDWDGPLKPQVLLSYTTTVANSLIGFAFAEVAVIGFWSNALDSMPVSTLRLPLVRAQG
ncbi:hypothetical protein B0T20DRAFT_484464 [Sordaria brevicollis]|uniref:Uncharacterized protein n=1 Tax=Sordaria brevicollis TaxID=83679 RepID=A0AAE0NVC4_SORBR|nr:hypothetical protein B0T20DRAFT_484464 [Sordaria brevicollis]